MTGRAATGSPQQSTRHSLLRSSQPYSRIRVDLQGYKQLEKEKFRIFGKWFFGADQRDELLQAGQMHAISTSSCSGVVWMSCRNRLGLDWSKANFLGTSCRYYNFASYDLSCAASAASANDGCLRRFLGVTHGVYRGGLLQLIKGSSALVWFFTMGSSKEGKHLHAY